MTSFGAGELRGSDWVGVLDRSTARRVDPWATIRFQIQTEGIAK